MPDSTTPLSNFPMGDPAEDIFEETDATTETPSLMTSMPPVGGGVVPPLAPRPTANPTMVPPPNPLAEIPGAEVPKPKNSRKMIMILVLVLLIVVVGGGLAYYFFMGNKDNANNNVNNTNTTNTNLNTNVNTNTNQAVNINNSNANTNSSQSGDTDGDGLLDSEEKQLGTSIQRPDTDSDELFDYEEVKVYNTDPLDSDTDSDTYLDGKEVKAGFDPNGPGKLLNIEDEINNINQSN
ncbi:MAG: hypothetical protein WCT13_03375 [Patescibacteria group bacterium]